MAISVSFQQSEDQIHPSSNDLCSVSKPPAPSSAQAHRHQRNQHQIHHPNSSVSRYSTSTQTEETIISAIREDLAAGLMKFA